MPVECVKLRYIKIKENLKMKKLLAIIFFSFLSVGLLNAQTVNRVKVNLGIGSIASISPSITTLDFGVATEFSTDFFGGENFLLKYFYSRKFEYFIPESREGRYYPYLQGAALEFLLIQQTGGFEFQEGLGPVLVHDRIFSDAKSLVGGMILTFNALLSLHAPQFNGWGVGAGANYGIAFGGDNPNYFAMDISLFYDF